MEKKAIIIGAGPAGLTAAYELLKRTDIKPIILEKSGDIGGISKTVNYKGNRIDIGGHRFFSKSDRVMSWWLNIMPIQAEGQTTFNISYQNKSREIDTVSLGAIDNAGEDPDKVMLVRRRLSRIYFLRKFFTYPIQLSLDTLAKLGLWTTIAIMFSYLKAQLLPRKPEKNLEDFMINRFGQVLYKLFFKDYTEKVWGIPCDKISAEWGAQRIKGVSISKAIQHAIQSATKKKQKVAGNDIAQKDTETSLIEQFLYPKFGPGQLWEEVARQVESMGGKILMHHDVKRIYTSDSNNQVTAVAAINNITGETSYLEGDYFFSTMPVQELIGGLDGPIPEDVKEVAAGLQYRDFITVGILLKKLSFQDKKTGEWKSLDLKDTWIYIQEKDVKVGRLQLFNNWSPYMVKDPDTAWVGMEFFCNKTDDFWNRPDEYIKDLAIRELEKIGLASQANVLDATVLRMEKTYPAYFGTYERFDLVREYVDRFENLFLVGRNGMHKYNNSDHSMLTAMVAVDNIVSRVANKYNIWSINTEQEYHEEKGLKDSGGKAAAQSRTPDLEGSISPIEGTTFFNFVWRIKGNRKLLITALFGMIAQFILFKILYPFPDFFADSYSYIFAAANGLQVDLRPIGYSKFLLIVHLISHTGNFLIGVQYGLTMLAAIYFYFSLIYFYKPSLLTRNILYAFFFWNPLLLFLCNYVSSDSLFTAMSLVWFSQIIWIINSNRPWLLLSHSILIALLLTVRYNALVYPIVTTLAYIFSSYRLRFKLLGIVFPLALIIAFIGITKEKTRQLTGTAQFSIFGGWQLANNALYMYPHIEVDTNLVPEDCRKLNVLTNRYFALGDEKLKHVSPFDGAFYIKHPYGPLKQYLSAWVDINDPNIDEVKSWGLVSPLYEEYGTHLIRKHPFSYARYFLLPNMKNYILPPLEKLEVYNLGSLKVGSIVKDWFEFRSPDITAVSLNFQGELLFLFPVFFLLINLYFIGNFVWIIATRKLAVISVSTKNIMIVSGSFFLLNLMFSVLASPVVFRYQVLPMLVLMGFTLIIIEAVAKPPKTRRLMKHNTVSLLPDSLVTTHQQVSVVKKLDVKSNVESTFKTYVFVRNKRILIIATILVIIQFVILKLIFPFVNYIPDSYSYLDAAYRNAAINIWPVGYSKFLRVFGTFFQSDTALALCQFILLQAAIMYFILTILYLTKAGKSIKWGLILFYVLNPMVLLISNYVVADAIFTALSIVWLTSLIWIQEGEQKYHIWVQVVLLVILMNIRYNALYYPLIAIFVVCHARRSWKTKVLGISLIILSIGILIWHNGNKYKELTGIRQFSGFGGWQLATNALMMYSKMNPTTPEVVPVRFKQFQSIVDRHRDSINRLETRPDSIPGIYYLWDERAPLKQYVELKMGDIPDTAYFRAWASIAPFYADYGRYLIRNHPIEFVKYYIWPNIKSYAVLPGEFFNVYNMNSDSVGAIAKLWFGYKSQKVYSVVRNIRVAIVFPAMITVANGLFLLGIVGYFLFIGLRAADSLKRIVVVIVILWTLNFIFSVLAAPMVLRYQLFTLIVYLPIGVLLFSKIAQLDNKTME